MKNMPPQEMFLNPGDMVVLTTDGFFEWENARDEDYGAGWNVRLQVLQSITCSWSVSVPPIHAPVK